jgi:hypothetical protein
MAVAHIGVVATKVGTLGTQALMPRRACHILLSLPCGCLHDVDAMNTCRGIALGTHYGDEARARADIEDATRISDICPRTQQDTIGAYLHRRQFVVYFEVLELKHDTRA